MNVPKLHQRHPGIMRGTTVHPHHGLISQSCSLLRGGYISHTSPADGKGTSPRDQALTLPLISPTVSQPAAHSLPHLIIQNGLLYCVVQRRGGEEKLFLVVPRIKTETVLKLVHSHPLAGHLGAANTTQRICDRFHWLGLEDEVKGFCQVCSTCQVMSPRTPPPVR